MLSQRMLLLFLPPAVLRVLGAPRWGCGVPHKISLLSYLDQKSAFQVLNTVTHITSFYVGSWERDKVALLERFHGCCNSAFFGREAEFLLETEWQFFREMTGQVFGK